MSKNCKMETSYSGLGQHLRKLRKEKGQTLHQVSKEADIDSPLLSKIETGERLPTDEQVKKLAVHYTIPESELLVMATAEKIIKEYGINVVTYHAVNLVMEHITPYLKNGKTN